MTKYDLFYHNAYEMYNFELVVRHRIADALRNHRRDDLTLKDAVVGWAYMNFPINVPGLMDATHISPSIIEGLKNETLPGELPDMGKNEDPEVWVIRP